MATGGNFSIPEDLPREQDSIHYREATGQHG